MTTKEYKKIEQLAKQAGQAVLLAQKKQFELETLLSVSEYKSGKVQSYKNVGELFKSLSIK